jgi:cytochrome c biogenesis protein ResB
MTNEQVMLLNEKGAMYHIYYGIINHFALAVLKLTGSFDIVF